MGGIPEQRDGSPEFHGRGSASDTGNSRQPSRQIQPIFPVEGALVIPEQLVDPALVLPPLPALPDDPDGHPD